MILTPPPPPRIRNLAFGKAVEMYMFKHYVYLYFIRRYIYIYIFPIDIKNHDNFPIRACQLHTEGSSKFYCGK